MVAGQLHTPAVQRTLYIDNMNNAYDIVCMYMLHIIMYTVAIHKHVHVDVHL